MTATPDTRYDLKQVPYDTPKWRWFAAWAGVGVLIPMTILGAFTIGLFMIPLAVVGTLLLASRPAARRGVVGLLAGFGAPFLALAFLNHAGPGNVCTTTVDSQSCTQEWSPWPWLVAGLLLVGVSVALFTRQREQHRRRLSTPPHPLP